VTIHRNSQMSKTAIEVITSVQRRRRWSAAEKGAAVCGIAGAGERGLGGRSRRRLCPNFRAAPDCDHECVPGSSRSRRPDTSSDRTRFQRGTPCRIDPGKNRPRRGVDSSEQSITSMAKLLSVHRVTLHRALKKAPFGPCAVSDRTQTITESGRS
jgi:hypothetical protein